MTTLQHIGLQLFDWYPALKPLYPFKFENDWNGYPWATFCLETMFVPFILSAVYFVGIFGTQVCCWNHTLNGRGRLRICCVKVPVVT